MIQIFFLQEQTERRVFGVETGFLAVENDYQFLTSQVDRNQKTLVEIMNEQAKESLEKTKNFHLAVKSFTVILLTDPSNVEALNQRAKANYQLGKYTNCINDLTIASRSCRASPEQLVEIKAGLELAKTESDKRTGIKHWLKRSYAEAQAAISKCLSKNPQDIFFNSMLHHLSNLVSDGQAVQHIDNKIRTSFIAGNFNIS